MTTWTLMSPGGATEVKQDDILASLASLLTELNAKLESGQAVALDAATLAALESVTTTVANWPADFPDAATLAKLEAIRALLDGVIDIAGTVDLSTATLAALETLNANVTGTVSVSNFPPSVEISNDSGSPIPITGTVTSTGAGLAVSEALNFTSHNLLSAGYSGTTSISGDYLLNGIELHFTTSADRTIRLTTEDGTVLREVLGDRSTNVMLDFGQKYMETGEDLTLTISQTSSACSVTGKLTVAQGSLALTGDSMIDTSHIINVRATSAFYNIRGQRYISTTGYVRQTFNVAGELIAAFRNPAGSDRVVLFDKAEFGATADTSFSRFGGGAISLIGSPTIRPIGRTDGGTASSVVQIYTAGNLSPQFTVSTPGTLRKVATMKAFDGYQLNDIYNSLALQPGQMSYWTVDEQPGGGSGNFNAYIDFEWVEITLAEWNALVAAIQAKMPY